MGVYIKQVVPNCIAAKEGSLDAGDRLLAVNGISLTGVDQKQAATILSNAGNLVNLTVAKNAARFDQVELSIGNAPHQPQHQLVESTNSSPTKQVSQNKNQNQNIEQPNLGQYNNVNQVNHKNSNPISPNNNYYDTVANIIPSNYEPKLPPRPMSPAVNLHNTSNHLTDISNIAPPSFVEQKNSSSKDKFDEAIAKATNNLPQQQQQQQQQSPSTNLYSPPQQKNPIKSPEPAQNPKPKKQQTPPQKTAAKIRQQRLENDALARQQREMQEQIDAMRDEEIEMLQSKGDALDDWDRQKLQELLDEREFASKYRTTFNDGKSDSSTDLNNNNGNNYLSGDQSQENEFYVPDRPDRAHLMKLRSTEALDQNTNHDLKIASSQIQDSQNNLNLNQPIKKSSIKGSSKVQRKVAAAVNSNINSSPENNKMAPVSNNNYYTTDNEYLQRQKARQDESERLRLEREETQRKLEELRLRVSTSSNNNNNQENNTIKSPAERSPSPPAMPAPNLKFSFKENPNNSNKDNKENEQESFKGSVLSKANKFQGLIKDLEATNNLPGKSNFNYRKPSDFVGKYY